MQLKTEIVNTKERVLIVSKNKLFLKLIKELLEKYQSEIHTASEISKNQSFKKYDYVFFIESIPYKEHLKKLDARCSLIFTDKRVFLHLSKILKTTSIKVVYCHPDKINKTVIQQILWFSFSSSKEKSIEFLSVKPNKKEVLKNKTMFKINLSKKSVIFLIVAVIVTTLFSFLPFLVFSSLNIVYKVKKGRFLKQDTSGEKAYRIASSLYKISRPVHLFLGDSLIVENVLNINRDSYNSFKVLNELHNNGKEIVKSLIKKDKTSQDISFLQMRFNNLDQELNKLQSNLEDLSKILPEIMGFDKYKNKLVETSKIVSNFRAFLVNRKFIFGDGQTRKYLLLFANNMELRPGGGFIGSFAVVKVKNYSLLDIKVYDVYDADGQLQVHIEPPYAIKEYLNQPHWFLRDSAFYPDFPQNYQEALFFLKKEMGMDNFSGGILLTTSAVEKIIGAFGDIYLTDFKENINADNFYIKTQIHSEKNFFPGSIQKKGFLNSIIKHLLINLEDADYQKLTKAIYNSLNEKQIVLYFADKKTQNTINSLFWSGRLISPQCNETKMNCLSNYIFPFSANLGVNKSNFFINKGIILKTKVYTDGKIKTAVTFKFINNSPEYTFPGGNYKNYFQIYLPKDIKINDVLQDSKEVKNYYLDEDVYTKLAIFFNLKPKNSTEIKIIYTLDNRLLEGSNIYQFIFQKQIGSKNSDLIFILELPSNTYIVNQNFSPLAKENKIIYNTNLSADKIFYIQLVKQKNQ